MSEIVDWELASATATRLVRSGPEVTREEAQAVVEELRHHARAAESHVRTFTGLSAPSGTGPVLIVDRPGWVHANVDGFQVILTPLAEKLRGTRGQSGAGSMIGAVGSKATGIEVGLLLAFLAGRVLGQFETFARAGDGAPYRGRLLLVAPNVVQAEREMGVEPHDFRLWVCIHEETHRTQFSAVPWLRDHLEGEIRAFLAETEVDPTAVAGRLRDAFETLAGAARGRRGETSFIDVVQTPKQRAILDRLTAVMSLLEGHAEYVMDGVGPRVIPSVAEIRAKFQKRREGVGRLDQALRRLLGLDVKLRQYREGEKFTRQVVEMVGMDGFNRVWTSPNTLPTRAEISDPESWVARVYRRAPEG